MSTDFARRVAYLAHAWECGNRNHVRLDLLEAAAEDPKHGLCLTAAFMHRLMIMGDSHAADFAVTTAMGIGEASTDYLETPAPQEGPGR